MGEQEGKAGQCFVVWLWQEKNDQEGVGIGKEAVRVPWGR